MKTVYLLQYDNQLDYEDYWINPLFLVETKERAEEIQNELNNWMREAYKNAPEVPHWNYDATEEEYEKWSKCNNAVQDYYDNLKQPYDLNCLTEELRNNNGTVRVKELRMLT